MATKTEVDTHPRQLHSLLANLRTLDLGTTDPLESFTGSSQVIMGRCSCTWSEPVCPGALIHKYTLNLGAHRLRGCSDIFQNDEEGTRDGNARSVIWLWLRYAPSLSRDTR